MRRHKVVVAQTAERDLENVVDYLSYALNNPKAAIGIIEQFEYLVDSLETMPSSHAMVRDELLASVGYRWAPIGSYMVFFTVDEAEGSVNIERVLYGARNWRAMLSPES